MHCNCLTMQYFLTTPVQLTHIALGLYNAYNIVGKDLGLFPVATVTMGTQTGGIEEGVGEGEAPGQSWF